MSDPQPDPHRSQILRQQISRVVSRKSVPDIIGAIEMVTADIITAMPGITEDEALEAAVAFAADIRNIIRERFAVQGKGH